MSERSVNVELPDEVWKVIDTQFKPLNEETDSEILSNIIKNHLAQNGYYPDVDSLMNGNGLKEIVDVIDDKVMSLMDLLKKGDLQVFKNGLKQCKKE